MYRVYTNPEGISLKALRNKSGRQFLLDDDNKVKEFASIPDVFKFLNDAGVDASTLEGLEEEFDIFVTEDFGGRSQRLELLVDLG